MSLRARAFALAAVVAVLALALVAGCGAVGGSSLDKTSWKLTGWTLSSLDPNSYNITASFADGKISGTSAVNSYGGDYSAGAGGDFSVSQVAATLMAGPEDAMRAEQAYTLLLSQARSYKVAGTTLTLYDAGGNESLIFTAVAK